MCVAVAAVYYDTPYICTLYWKSVDSRYDCTKSLHSNFALDKVDTFKMSNILSTISMNVAVSFTSSLSVSFSALATVHS